jgi:hypothetical protein
VHGVARAQVGDPRVQKGAADERAAMRRESQDVGNHPAVGEDSRRVAQGIDEGLIEAVFADDRIDTLDERRAGFGESGA